MKPHEQVRAWRAEGYRVSIHYDRRVEQILVDGSIALLNGWWGVMDRAQANWHTNHAVRIFPRGGLATLTLSGGPLPEGEYVQVQAKCSDEDCFVKRVAFHKVVGMALRELKRRGV